MTKHTKRRAEAPHPNYNCGPTKHHIQKAAARQQTAKIDLLRINGVCLHPIFEFFWYLTIIFPVVRVTPTIVKKFLRGLELL
jgi:hypothetical protein